MEKCIIKMSDILAEERDIFKDIYSLEEKKSEAIINQDGSALNELSIEQEKLLNRIESLEKKRIQAVKNYRKIKKTGSKLDDVTLQEIADSEGAGSSGHIITLGRDLKEIMTKLSGLQECNMNIANDNMNFYNVMINGLKNSISIDPGYGQDGKEGEKVSSSLLFDQTA